MKKIQEIQVLSNMKLNETEERMEAEIRRAMASAAEKTPDDPLGKETIARIRARYHTLQEKAAEDTVLKLEV